MRYTRIYTGAGGESHFEDVEVALEEASYAPPAPPFLLSALSQASGLAWTTIPSGWFGDWHPTPRVQWWLQLAGELEVWTSDGAMRRFDAGSVVLLEDTTGRGHTTRVMGDEDVVAAYVRIPD